jgi:shikimate kinase
MMPGRNKVYIIGFMGSGKTTTGLKLAGLLGWDFTDLDKSIEEQTGMTIPEIFSSHGEAWFREVESKILRNLQTLNNTVVSTGGGTPCYGDNMDFMLDTGLTIYLKLTPGQLKSRLSGTNGERPLLNDLGENGLLGFIEEKLAIREKWYNRAELNFSGFDTDVRFIYSQVRSRLNV